MLSSGSEDGGSKETNKNESNIQPTRGTSRHSRTTMDAIINALTSAAEKREYICDISSELDSNYNNDYCVWSSNKSITESTCDSTRVLPPCMSKRRRTGAKVDPDQQQSKKTPAVTWARLPPTHGKSQEGTRRKASKRSEAKQLFQAIHQVSTLYRASSEHLSVFLLHAVIPGSTWSLECLASYVSQSPSRWNLFLLWSQGASLACEVLPVTLFRAP